MVDLSTTDEARELASSATRAVRRGAFVGAAAAVEPGRALPMWTGNGVVVGAAVLHDTHGGGLNRATGAMVSALLSRHDGVRAVSASTELGGLFPEAVIPIRSRTVAEASSLGNLARFAWHQTLLPRLLRRRRASVFFSPVAEGMLSPPCPQVVTIPDLIPLHFPEMFARLDVVYRHVLPRLVAASTSIVTMSESTRRDLLRLFPAAVGDRPVHVVLQGYRADLFRPLPEERRREVRARFGLGRFLLAVGEARPYKNIRGLVKAFAAGGFDGVQLALVGRGYRSDPELSTLADALGVGERVRFLDFVPDGDLAALYSAAEAFVFPSFYEGFGLPLLEAMACGCPVVSSTAASLPEVCGDAAVYVDPASTADIARGIAAVLTDGDLRARLRAQGLERVRGFTYERAAGQVMTILEGVRC